MLEMEREVNNINVLTLGCAKNLVDSERFSGLLKANGFNFTETADKADAVIINTCGFIKAAKEENVNVILEAAEMRKRGDIKKLIVTGCLSERYGQELKDQIQDVDYFLGVNSDKKILKILSGDQKYTLTGERMLFTPKNYAYLKISEGCNQVCTFCAIPLMRGKHISEPIDKLVREAKRVAKLGTKELVLIAQDSTFYGKDQDGVRKISTLLNEISKVDGIEWIRMMYAYPRAFPYEVLDVIAENPKICKYIDIPLQHISDNVLRSMKRGIKARKIRFLLDQIRANIPNVAIRSTFIVGYPNETEADFEELLGFLEEQMLDRVGVFTYSHEEGTGAFHLGDPIPEEVKQERRRRFMMVQQQISRKKNQKKIGQTFKVMIDDYKDGKYIGRTQYDAPEVDNSVHLLSDRKLNVGDFVDATIYDAGDYDLYGDVI